MGRKGGRPTRLTPELQRKIVALISQSGAYAKVAALSVGISERTFYKWMHRGANSNKQPYHDFFNDIVQAEAVAEVATGKKLFKGNKAWISAATWLERTRRERWSRSDKLLIGPTTGPVEVRIIGPDGGVKLGSVAGKQMETAPGTEIDVTPDKVGVENGA